MKTLLIIFVLNVVFLSLSVSGSGDPDNVICAFQGKVLNPNFDINIQDIPAGCKIIVPCMYHIDGIFNDKDKDVIKALVAAKKTVYVVVTSANNVIDDLQVETKRKQMVGDLQALNVNGIILDGVDVYVDSSANNAKGTEIKGDKPDYSEKIASSVKSVKNEYANLKVGILIAGIKYEQFAKFNFLATNEQIDYYIIDILLAGEECDQDISKSGRYPMKSDVDYLPTLDKVSQIVKTTSMAKDKTVITQCIATDKVTSREVKELSYTDYCNKDNSDNDGNTVWCADSTELLYKNAEFVKKHFNGMMLMYLSRDDSKGSCNCDKLYPVTNIYIDGWLGNVMPTCSAISGPSKTADTTSD